MTKELLQQALEALEYHTEQIRPIERTEIAIKTLRAAIAQPVQPVQPAYPDPTSDMLNGDALFDAIWRAIKGWDISRLNDGMYSGPSGNDARHIYDAIKATQPAQPPTPKEYFSDMINRLINWFAAGKTDLEQLKSGYDYAAGYLLSTEGKDPRYIIRHSYKSMHDLGADKACRDWEKLTGSPVNREGRKRT